MLKYAKPRKALAVLLLTISLLTLGQVSNQSQALHISNHSIRVSTALINATASHNFQFTYPSTDVVGSIVLLYCDGGALQNMACNAPAGLDVSGASLASQTGNTGFSIDGANSTSNKIVLTRAAAAGSMVLSTYNFNNMVNPSSANTTTYVRISTYQTTDGTGPDNDDGAVAFSTVNPYQVSTNVPPFLKLCVGIIVSNDCTATSGNSLDLGILTKTATKYGSSQFSAGTNSVTGYNIYSLGTTMTSGNNILPAINPASSSSVGSSQFGINLRTNGNPAVGQDPVGPGTATPTANYNSPNIFKYQNGDLIASSNLPTDFRKMTVSYVVNIDGSQPAGVYATTITYLGIAQF